MRHILWPGALPAFFILLFTSAATPLLPGGPDEKDVVLGSDYCFRGVSQGMVAAAGEHLILEHPFDIRHYRLELQPDMNSGQLEGVAEVRCISEIENLDEIVLNFVGSWSIGDVTVDGVSADSDHDGEVLTVQLPELLKLDEEFTVRIPYSGTPGQASDHQIPAFQINSDFAFTMSQPFQARYWFPCFDEPSDKAEDGVKTLVTVPQSFTVASNGSLTETHQNGGNVTFVWDHPYAIASYLIAVAIDEYVIINDQYKNIPLRYYVLEAQREATRYDLARQPEMFQYFESKFGPYPFEAYGVVVVPSRGFAMEHQTMTTYSETVITGDRRLETVAVHELAHHWWGDAVTLADYRDIWLNEGFASYCEILWAEHLGGAAARDEMVRQFEQRYKDDHAVHPLALYRDSYDVGLMFSRTVYMKGALVLHALRWELGDKKFFKGLQEYFKQYKYKTVATPDFRAVMEEVSGRDLERFFKGWLYGIGWPRFAISSYLCKGDNGKERVITVQQTQDGSAVYDVTLPIDPDGSGPMSTGRYLVDSTWSQFVVPVGKNAADPEIQATDWLVFDSETADYPEPSVNKIKGRKLRAGRKGKIVLTGENFTPATRVFIDSPDVTIRKVKIKKGGSEIRIKVRIAEDAEKSKFGFRVVNPDGDAYERNKGLRILTK